MTASDHEGRVCEKCGAWVLWDYTAHHQAFHEDVDRLLYRVHGVCPSCKKPYDEPRCEADDHLGALVERWDVKPSALKARAEAETAESGDTGER